MKSLEITKENEYKELQTQKNFFTQQNDSRMKILSENFNTALNLFFDIKSVSFKRFRKHLYIVFK